MTEQKKYELRPCPFCNGTELKINAVDDEGMDLECMHYDDERGSYEGSNAANMGYDEWLDCTAWAWYVSCPCGAQMWDKTKNKAIKNWNRREM